MVPPHAIDLSHIHGVWKSQKKYHSSLPAKRATLLNFLSGQKFLKNAKYLKFLVQFIIFFIAFQNGDGFISAKELGVLMRTLGRNPTEDEIMNIMNEIDVDHNGKLDFSEFTIMMRDKLSGEDMEQEIKQAFR